MTGPAAAEMARDGVKVTGPDAESFLQGQLSQDVAGLAAGESRWSLLLEPTGKVVAWLRVTRTGDEEFLLDVEHGYGSAVVERLQRFLIRISCVVEPESLRMLAVRGPGSRDVELEAQVRHDPGWPGVEGLDVVGETITRPAGLADLSDDELERLRIEGGIPAMGREITTDVIPAELELVDRSVDFDKGCYTGQELVARIDSRGGNVPRRLRIVEVDGRVPPVGATVFGEGQASGALSSVVGSSDGAVGLALVHRRIDAPAGVTVRWDDIE
ncbi:MAG: folate-binding protein YgfZ, partial [Acidimicrobiales bacterium]